MPRPAVGLNAKQPLDDAFGRVVEWVRGMAPGAVDAVKGAAESLLGPENPPVHYAQKLMRQGDPMNAMGIAMPLQRFDSWGRAIKVSGEGVPLAKTAKDISNAQAAAEAAAQVARKAEAASGGMQSVAFRNLATGEVIKGGRTHPGSFHMMPENATLLGYETKPMPGIPVETQWEAGFIGPGGDFLSRQEAAKVVGKGARGDPNTVRFLDATDPEAKLGGLMGWLRDLENKR